MNIEAAKPRITALANKYDINLIVLFGSQATGQTHPESDIDIGYAGNKKLSFEDEIQMNTDFTEIFGNDNIQLVNIKTAPPLLLKKIFQEAIVLYEGDPHIFDTLYIYAAHIIDEARVLFELRRQYLDYKLKAHA